jgi:glycosyltransferase involved in cell wall biosynthesis
LQVLRASVRFYLRLLGPARGSDVAFVCQGGQYPALLLPWKLLLRRPVVQWKAMPHISARMRFYARYCDDLVFTATPGSFPMELDTVRVVGHGIDTDLFRPVEGAPARDLVVVTRIAPVKQLDVAIRAVARHRDRTGRAVTLDIVGPCDSKSEAHRDELVGLIDELGLGDTVRLVGSVEQADLPELLAGYRAALNLSTTAFDKAAGEAMAAGLALISSNPRVAEALPADLRADLVVPDADVDALAAAIERVLSWTDEQRRALGRRLRELVVAEHGLHALFDKIVRELDGLDAARRSRGGHATGIPSTLASGGG